MRKISYGLAGFALLALGLGTANAQDKVKIGIILPYSGQFADTAAQVDNAITVSYTHLDVYKRQVLR